MVAEYRAIWNVPGGGTGYSVFHFNDPGDAGDAQDAANAIRIFFAAIVTLLPDDVTITFDNEMRVLNPSTGTLTGVFPVSPPASVVGSGVGTWANAVGTVVTWDTGSIVGGRRLRGRTFIVPLIGTAYDNAGTIASASIVTLFNAADTLRTNLLAAVMPLAVWSRAHGQIALVQSASVNDRTAVLRGRRD